MYSSDRYLAAFRGLRLVACCSLFSSAFHLLEMLRHGSALRCAASCSGRIGLRNRRGHHYMSIAAASRPNTHHIPRSSAGLLFCAHLHHDARRRREGNGSGPPIPRTSLVSGLVGSNRERLALERSALAAMARAQQAMMFSSGEGGVKNKAEQAQAGMDAETKRSIGEGDKKSEKSMQTVKVGARHAACRSSLNALHFFATRLQSLF